jgi:hypothetical protein
MCDVAGCPNNSVAKGLCAKHYMRQRRHGDASTARKRGPASERPAGVSARTWSRFARAGRLFQALGYPREDFVHAMEQTKRRNGKFNVSALLRCAQYILEDRQQPVIILPPPPKD